MGGHADHNKKDRIFSRVPEILIPQYLFIILNSNKFRGFYHDCIILKGIFKHKTDWNDQQDNHQYKRRGKKQIWGSLFSKFRSFFHFPSIIRQNTHRQNRDACSALNNYRDFYPVFYLLSVNLIKRCLKITHKGINICIPVHIGN